MDLSRRFGLCAAWAPFWLDRQVFSAGTKLGAEPDPPEALGVVAPVKVQLGRSRVESVEHVVQVFTQVLRMVCG